MIEVVQFTPEADDDFAVAYAWYEEREPGLGEAAGASVVGACVS